MSFMIDVLHRKGLINASDVARQLRTALADLPEAERANPRWAVVEQAAELIGMWEEWTGRLPTLH